MWGNWRWAGEMWGNPFLTSEDVRKYSKSFLAINLNVRKMWGIFFSTCVEKSIWATETKKNPLGEFFRIWIFFYHVRVWCSAWPQLNFNAMPVWQKPICVLEVGWEPLRSVISLPSEVVSGSLLRLLKFLLVFKLAVRFAASSALPIGCAARVFPETSEWSWSLRAIEHLAMSSWLSGMERNFAEKLD